MEPIANRYLVCLSLALAMLTIACGHAGAVEVLVDGTGTIVHGDPGNQVPNWTTGWGASNITGWDYMGSVNGNASAMYLGNNWVITAGHIGSGNFILDGTTYNMLAGTARSIVGSSGSTADLTLFELAASPNLPALSIASHTNVGTPVVMLGNGGGSSWGYNTITDINVEVQVGGFAFQTTDFETAYGAFSTGMTSGTNKAVLISGDSGGGAFTYNTATGKWQLAGIEEAVDDSSDSYMVELSAYSMQINQATTVPEPGTSLLAALALPALAAGLGQLRRGKKGVTLT